MFDFFYLISKKECEKDMNNFLILHKKAQESIIEKYGRLLTEEECIKWTEEAKKMIYNNED